MSIRNNPFQPTEYTNDSLGTPILEENNIREKRHEYLKDLYIWIVTRHHLYQDMQTKNLKSWSKKLEKLSRKTQRTNH